MVRQSEEVRIGKKTTTVTKDGPEAQTWTDFEEDCDAVNQASASKINDNGYSAYQRVFGRNPPQMKDAIFECGGANLEAVSRQQAGELTQERSMTMTRFALQASLALDHKRHWKRAHQVQATWSECSQETNKRFLPPGRCHQQLFGHSLNRGSVVRCARHQVRPFHEDDEAAHEHVTEHMRKLGEGLPLDGAFPHEDITGQDEPPVDSPPVPGESTVTKPPRPSGEEPMEVEPDVHRRMRGETRTVSTDHPTAPPSNAATDAARQETAGDLHDVRRRVHEPETPLSPVAQNEGPMFHTVSFDMETRNDEIAADVPLPQEPAEMSSDQPQGWITEQACFTVSPGARQVRQRMEVKMSQLTPAVRCEFLKSMDTEWQTLLKNQAAKVL